MSLPIGYKTLSYTPVIPQDYAISTPMISGHIKIRRQHHKLSHQYSVRLLIDKWDYHTLMTWYDQDPGRIFDHLDELTGSLKQYKIIPGSISTDWVDKSRRHMIVNMIWQEVG